MKRFCAIFAAVLIFAGVGVDAADELPLRETFESAGASIAWNGGVQPSITMDYQKVRFEFTVGSNEIGVDGSIYKMEEPVMVQDDTSYISPDTVELVDNLVLYHNAVVDAMQADYDEILPLRAIDKTQDEVLVATWHRYPDSYPAGQEAEINHGEVWVFTAEEIKEWSAKQTETDNMELRLQQLIGLPPQKGYTHFSLLWVDPDDLFRPSPDNEIDDTTVGLSFPENAAEEYQNWFNGNILYSYYPLRYPWTRLGYTYDWADNGTEYGLSEFIIRNHAKVRVEKTYTNEEFFDYLAQ